MPKVQIRASEVAIRYAAQVEADLERNVQEQARVDAHLKSLQELLQVLRHDQWVLVNIRQTLSGPVAPTSLLTQEASEALGPDSPEKARPSHTKRASARATSVNNPLAKGAAAEAAADQPSLISLVRGQLEKEIEPRSAAEITTALVRTHPDRNIKATVVRTTVENLVARKHALRHKQGYSVFYSVGDPSGQTHPTAGS
ncbi:hypothetical protein ACIP5U_38025 [Streptomyces sp. NPDC088788]|uniref:hypothetical protein n=1 Tax=Streptomyces sp. NPDC088788 TaxID=3365898 RepID=UPI0038101AE6